MKKRLLNAVLMSLCAMHIHAAEPGENKQLPMEVKDELSRRVAQGASARSFNENFLGQYRDEDLKIQKQIYKENQPPESVCLAAPARVPMRIQQHPIELKSSQEFKKQWYEWKLLNLNTRYIICMTYDMCDNPFAKALQNAEVYENYWYAQIYSLIVRMYYERPHILGLQGIREDKKANEVLQEILNHMGYDVIMRGTRDVQDGFLNIIAYNKKYVTLTREDFYWPSRTPEKPSDNWGNGVPRKIMMAMFYPTQENNLSADYDLPPIIVTNVPSGPIRLDCSAAKINLNRIYVAKLQQLLKSMPGIGLVIGGDLMSAEGSEKEAEERAIFSDNGFCDLINVLKTEKGTLIEKRELTRDAVGQIQCAMRARSNIAAAYWSYVNTEPCDPPEVSAILSKIDRKKYPDLPSARLPVIARLIVASKK